MIEVGNNKLMYKLVHAWSFYFKPILNLKVFLQFPNFHNIIYNKYKENLKYSEIYNTIESITCDYIKLDY